VTRDGPPTPALPRAAAPFQGLARLLRRHGFAVAPEQTVGFMRAVALLGPRSMADVYEAAFAMLAPPVDRRAEFDAHFRGYFHGEGAAGVEGEEDEARARDGRFLPGRPFPTAPGRSLPAP